MFLFSWCAGLIFWVIGVVYPRAISVPLPNKLKLTDLLCTHILLRQILWQLFPNKYKFLSFPRSQSFIYAVRDALCSVHRWSQFHSSFDSDLRIRENINFSTQIFETFLSVLLSEFYGPYVERLHFVDTKPSFRKQFKKDICPLQTKASKIGYHF